MSIESDVRDELRDLIASIDVQSPPTDVIRRRARQRRHRQQAVAVVTAVAALVVVIALAAARGNDHLRTAATSPNTSLTLSPAPSTTPSSLRPPSTADVAPCSAADFTADVVHPSPATGREAPILVLTNASAAPCAVNGYPNVVFRAADGSAIPFEISHTGGQIVTANPPAELLVKPGNPSYVRFEKYRCDTITVNEVASAVLSFGSGSITIPASLYDGFGYCGPSDPGSTVIVSPFEPSVDATFRNG